VLGGTALHQLWLFIVAPLTGGVIAALVYIFFMTGSTVDAPADAIAVDL
jgi:glycerol uptake facilitator-like aquaporin